jgi:hypothetical protein
VKLSSWYTGFYKTKQDDDEPAATRKRKRAKEGREREEENEHDTGLQEEEEGTVSESGLSIRDKRIVGFKVPATLNNRKKMMNRCRGMKPSIIMMS